MAMARRVDTTRVHSTRKPTIYSDLNSKFESLNTHVRKLETQVVLTANTIKRQEVVMKGKGDDSLKHHVNAIMDDDLWQVVKEEKLQEGDFQVENSMSFGGSHWCRSTPSFEHRLKEIDEHRSTSVSPHRSTEEVATCATVRILTHEAFAARHHHLPQNFSSSLRDQSAPVYITIGDGGNIEGLATNIMRFDVLYGFWKMTEPQPKYSAFREASFGHTILSIKNRTHTHYGWHRNQDSYTVEADTMWFYNRFWHPINDSPSFHS
ncbi:hypothetical protein F2Q70_00030819 [Brassica cretica]|uniref:Purple acid phosphatase C-terminal domain-containing protein n=1 Tax=Brassica cretica TaxID=69181 RepID=A0A8S9FGB5_BRACR|nr:hypothetical protein F2Q70_00030819 [Brassica cretica]